MWRVDLPRQAQQLGALRPAHSMPAPSPQAGKPLPGSEARPCWGGKCCGCPPRMGPRPPCHPSCPPHRQSHSPCAGQQPRAGLIKGSLCLTGGKGCSSSCPLSPWAPPGRWRRRGRRAAARPAGICAWRGRPAARRAVGTEEAMRTGCRGGDVQQRRAGSGRPRSSPLWQPSAPSPAALGGAAR